MSLIHQLTSKKWYRLNLVDLPVWPSHSLIPIEIHLLRYKKPSRHGLNVDIAPALATVAASTKPFSRIINLPPQP
jgi:hypothetical protein